MEFSDLDIERINAGLAEDWELDFIADNLCNKECTLLGDAVFGRIFTTEDVEAILNYSDFELPPQSIEIVTGKLNEKIAARRGR